MSMEMVKFGLDIFSGIGNNYLAKAQVRAQNKVNEANTYARNLMRGANNELVAKRGSLARWVQVENNNRTLKETGSALEAAAVNYRRARDEGMRGSLEQQIGFSEQAGAQAAASAASGLTGGVSDVVAGTMALRRERIEGAQADKVKAGEFDAARQQANILAAGLSALDNSSIIDDLDYGIDVYSPQAAPTMFGAVLGAVTKNIDNMPKILGSLKPKFTFNSPVESYYGVQ